jgi:DNA-3-methyladenine glycosylase II
LYFRYENKETDYLKSRDKLLGEAIDKIGHIKRPVDTDLFSSVIHHIIGQQISTAAQKTIWQRMRTALGEVNTNTITRNTVEELQKLGMTFKKAGYIRDFADRVNRGVFDIEALNNKSDAVVISELSALKGIGVWTAEMIMTFCMQRPDVFSFGDLAIHRGLRMLYHHKNVDKKLFETYRRRYSPYGTVASLYIWAIAGGAIPEMRDFAPNKKVQTGVRK